MCSWATGARNGRSDLGGGRHAGGDGRGVYTGFQPLPQGHEARSVHALLDGEPGCLPQRGPQGDDVAALMLHLQDAGRIVTFPDQYPRCVNERLSRRVDQ
jgi:hypothetical protein